MSKFLDMDGLQYYTNKFKPGLANVIDNGEKNLLDCSLETLKSINPTGNIYQITWSDNIATSGLGATFIINSDNTISISANSTTQDIWFKLGNNFIYDVGTYILSGCPQGGSTSSYFIESDNLNIRDIGDSIPIICTSTYSYK